MVRFKVIKASKLMLYIAIGVLALVLCILIARYVLSEPSTPVNSSANLVEAAQSDEAKTKTVFASSGATDAKDNLPLDPIGDENIQIEIISEASQAPESDQPMSVLIYHTHTHEAYEQVTDDPYVALEAWRTMDADHSVVRVGEELTQQLQAYGFEVVHDTTDHEGIELSTAYLRSLETLKQYDRSFDLYIDLHRDAYINGMNMCLTDTDGESMANLMLLIGNGNGFSEKPYYKQNNAFACALTDRINADEPGLCKDVLVKDGRYNQHIGMFSILVEVGHNRNTLQEALNCIPTLAASIYSLMVDAPEQTLVQLKEAYERTP